jgi:hypothetical protein
VLRDERGRDDRGRNEYWNRGGGAENRFRRVGWIGWVCGDEAGADGGKTGGNGLYDDGRRGEVRHV